MPTGFWYLLPLWGCLSCKGGHEKKTTTPPSPAPAAPSTPEVPVALPSEAPASAPEPPALAAESPTEPTQPAITGPLSSADRRVLDDIGAKWLKAARSGDGKTLASMTADPLKLGRMDFDAEECGALLKAPVPHGKIPSLARCMRVLFKYAPSGENTSRRRISGDRLEGRWMLRADCDSNADQYVSLELKAVADDWRVARIQLVSECDDP